MQRVAGRSGGASLFFSYGVSRDFVSGLQDPIPAAVPGGKRVM